jgi:hypothetical protein
MVKLFICEPPDLKVVVLSNGRRYFHTSDGYLVCEQCARPILANCEHWDSGPCMDARCECPRRRCDDPHLV